MKTKLPGLLAGAALITFVATPAFAQTPADLKVGLDTVWVLLTAALVFFMNLGFALVESAFCRSKNTVNILSKNFIVFAISCLAFYIFGWGLMFGNGNGFVGMEGLFTIGGADNSPATGDAYVGAYKAIAWTGVPLYAKFFFQLVFAGTAATIVSGVGRGTHQILLASSSSRSSWSRSSIRSPATGSGAAAGSRRRVLGLRRIDGRPQRRRLGRPGGHPGPRTAPRQVRPGRQGQPDPAPQLHVSRHRLLCAVAGLVRVQSRLDDGG